MSNDLNQCNFIGRLGQDVELRYTQDSNPIANISLAVGWKSKNSEGVEWVKCVAFGKLAEIMNEYLTKGSKIFVSGRQRTRKWQNQQGQDQYTTEIVINELQMLDGRPQQGQGNQQQRTQGGQAYAPGGQQRQHQDEPPPFSPDNDFDDIPF